MQKSKEEITNVVSLCICVCVCVCDEIKRQSIVVDISMLTRACRDIRVLVKDNEHKIKWAMSL